LPQWAELAFEAKEVDYKLGKIKRSFREVKKTAWDALSFLFEIRMYYAFAHSSQRHRNAC
jgi:hypothetical protein